VLELFSGADRTTPTFDGATIRSVNEMPVTSVTGIANFARVRSVTMRASEQPDLLCSKGVLDNRQSRGSDIGMSSRTLLVGLVLSTLTFAYMAPASAAPKASAVKSDSQPTIAVLDLSATPQEEEMAVTAADALNAELISTKSYTVVERRKIAQVIKEQALGQAGVISEESAAKVGALVGAKLLVTGRLSRIGDLYRLDARVLDSESGRVVVARHAEFSDRKNLQLAVKEVAAGLADPSKPAHSDKSGGATAAVAEKVAPDIVVDPAKVKDAARELVQQVGDRFKKVKAKIGSVDEAGRATFSAGDQVVFAGMKMEVFGEDEMTGGRARKGSLIVRRADSGDGVGDTQSDSAPIDSGDEIVSLPFAASVNGPSKDAVKAVTKALESLSNFTVGDNKRGTPVRIELDLKGTRIGERHLILRVVDPQDTVQATYESDIGL
jgi:TolB-like protein